MRVWSSIAHLSFPYYVACTGLMSMVIVASRHVGWQGPLAVLPVMVVMYRCYQRYFAPGAEERLASTFKPLSRAAGAHWLAGFLPFDGAFSPGESSVAKDGPCFL